MAEVENNQRKAPAAVEQVKKVDPFKNIPDLIEERRGDGEGSVVVNRFIKGLILGKGGFAQVYVSTLVPTKDKYALKIVAKASLVKPRAKQKLETEISIHRALKHEHICRFSHFFEDANFAYLILELCANNSMSEMMNQRKRITEPESRYYLAQLINSLHYLHQHLVIHRDLKLGNLFLDRHMRLKVGDFGLAAKLENPTDRRMTICGTPNYIAPELLADGKKGHSFEIDIWSTGIILYTFLVGKPPFQSKDVKSTYKRILSNSYAYPDNLFISVEAKDLIARLLKNKPEERLTLPEIFAHAFFTSPGAVMPHSIPVTALKEAPMIIPAAPGAMNNYQRPSSSSAVNSNAPLPLKQLAVLPAAGHRPHPSSSSSYGNENNHPNVGSQLPQQQQQQQYVGKTLGGEEPPSYHPMVIHAPSNTAGNINTPALTQPAAITSNSNYRRAVSTTSTRLIMDPQAGETTSVNSTSATATAAGAVGRITARMRSNAHTATTVGFGTLRSSIQSSSTSTTASSNNTTAVEKFNVQAVGGSSSVGGSHDTTASNSTVGGASRHALQEKAHHTHTAHHPNILTLQHPQQQTGMVSKGGAGPGAAAVEHHHQPHQPAVTAAATSAATTKPLPTRYTSNARYPKFDIYQDSTATEEKPQLLGTATTAAANSAVAVANRTTLNKPSSMTAMSAAATGTTTAVAGNKVTVAGVMKELEDMKLVEEQQQQNNHHHYNNSSHAQKMVGSKRQGISVAPVSAHSSITGASVTATTTHSNNLVIHTPTETSRPKRIKEAWNSSTTTSTASVAPAVTATSRHNSINAAVNVVPVNTEPITVSSSSRHTTVDEGLQQLLSTPTNTSQGGCSSTGSTATAGIAAMMVIANTPPEQVKTTERILTQMKVDTIETMHTMIDRSLATKNNSTEETSTAVTRRSTSSASAGSLPTVTPAATASAAMSSSSSSLTPAVQLWITRYVDYTSKYGLGFLFNNGSSGVIFNDSTKIVIDGDGKVFQYIERNKNNNNNGVNNQSNSSEHTSSRYTLDNYPKEIHKKVVLLSHFRQYLLEQEKTSRNAAAMAAANGGAGGGSKEAAEGTVPPNRTIVMEDKIADHVAFKTAFTKEMTYPSSSSLSSTAVDTMMMDYDHDHHQQYMDLPYLKKYIRTKHAILFRFSNRTVQVVFHDRSEILLSSEARVITFVNKLGERSEHALDDAVVTTRVDIAKRLKYTKDIMHRLITNKQY